MCLHIAKYSLEVLSGLCVSLKQAGHMKIGCRVNWFISLITDVPATTYVVPEDDKDKVKGEAGDVKGKLYMSTLVRKGAEKRFPCGKFLEALLI